MDYVDIHCKEDAELEISRYRKKKHKKVEKVAKHKDIKSSKTFKIKKEIKALL